MLNNIKWNGTIWVAVGKGNNSIAYSEDDKEWTGVGKDIFTPFNI